MKKLLIAFLFAATAAVSNAAVIISLSGDPAAGPQFSVPGGSLVPDGSVVRIGTLSGAAPAGATFEQLAGLFQEFGRTTVGTNAEGNDNGGRIQRTNLQGGGEPNSPEPDSTFVGKSVYIWVYSGDQSTTTAQGLFASATTFKDQATAVSVSMGSFVTAYGLFADNPSQPARSNLTGNTASSYTLAAPVPEPSGMIFAALGSLALIARRKR